MKRNVGFITFAILAIAGLAAAGSDVAIELSPDTPGPYAVDGDLNVGVLVTIRNLDAIDRDSLRIARFDFADTHPLISLNDPFGWSGPLGDSLYNRVPGYPLPSATYTGTFPISGFIADLPANGTLSLGTIHLTLPAIIGDYTLDVLNADASGPGQGALIAFGFAEPPIEAPTELLRPAGGLTGGSITLSVVPEPGCCLLLVGGAAWLVTCGRLRFRSRTKSLRREESQGRLQDEALDSRSSVSVP